MRDFMIEDPSRLDNLEASSWRAEYQRLVDNTPEICTEVCRFCIKCVSVNFLITRFWVLTLTRYFTCLFVKAETSL